MTWTRSLYNPLVALDSGCIPRRPFSSSPTWGVVWALLEETPPDVTIKGLQCGFRPQKGRNSTDISHAESQVLVVFAWGNHENSSLAWTYMSGSRTYQPHVYQGAIPLAPLLGLRHGVPFSILCLLFESVQRGTPKPFRAGSQKERDTPMVNGCQGTDLVSLDRNPA